MNQSEQAKKWSASGPTWTYYIWRNATARVHKTATSARPTSATMPVEGNETWKLIGWAEGGHVTFI